MILDLSVFSRVLNLKIFKNHLTLPFLGVLLYLLFLETTKTHLNYKEYIKEKGIIWILL